MAVTNIRREICQGVATALTGFIGAGLNVFGEPQDEADQTNYPMLVVIPRQLTFEPCSADIERDDQSDSANVLVEVGAFTGQCELRLFTRAPAEREAWEQLVIDSFMQVEGAPGRIVVSTASFLTVGAMTSTSFKGQGAILLDTVEWRDEMVFDDKRYTYLECDLVVGAYAARAAYQLTELVLALSASVNQDLTSVVPDAQWVVNQDGTLTKYTGP